MSYDLKGNIACIDDDEELLFIMGIYLKRYGATVYTFTNPAEAIERCKTCQMDLVVTDYMMPTMSGIDVLERIRTMDPNIPVIIYTGEPDQRLMESSSRLGAFDVNIKSYDLYPFVQAVQRGLSQRKMLATG